jgi:hypothetical protein
MRPVGEIGCDEKKVSMADVYTREDMSLKSKQEKKKERERERERERVCVCVCGRGVERESRSWNRGNRGTWWASGPRLDDASRRHNTGQGSGSRKMVWMAGGQLAGPRSSRDHVDASSAGSASAGRESGLCTELGRVGTDVQDSTRKCRQEQRTGWALEAVRRIGIASAGVRRALSRLSEPKRQGWLG